MPKYKFVNGVMVKEGEVPTKGTNTVPLAIVATPDDIAEASQVQTAFSNYQLNKNTQNKF